MGNLNCRLQEQFLEVYYDPAEVPQGASNCQVQGANALLTHWTEGFYNSKVNWKVRKSQAIKVHSLELKRISK